MNLVETPHCCTICDAKKLCHVCRTATRYACADCQIDLGATIYVCPTAACREGHERSCPAVLRTKLDDLRTLARDNEIVQGALGIVDPARALRDAEFVLIEERAEKADADLARLRSRGPALVQQWRVEAERLHANQGTLDEIEGDQLEACADELEEMLSRSGDIQR